MNLRPVFVLPLLRELWSMPRDMARFRAYLEKVKNGPEGEIFAPIVAANPMARESMVAFLDALDAFGAERVMAEACGEASQRLSRSGLNMKMSLVPIDDIGGAWSQRAPTDFENRFGSRKPKGGPGKYGFLSAHVFVSEPVTAALVRERVLAAAYRAAHVARHGWAGTVGAMMEQEGNALLFAGASGPRLADEERARKTLAPHLGATLHATRFAAMYGDEAASAMGHAPLGLPENAGFAVALADARARGVKPETLA